MVALACNRELRTQVPLNYGLLAMVTFLETCTVAGFVSMFSTASVLMCIGILACVTSSLFIVSLFLPKDSRTLAKFMGIGLAITICLNIMLLVMLFSFGLLPTWLTVVYASLGVVSAGIFILVDLLMIQSEMMDYDDYIMGALNLYLDLMRMFIYLLMLLGKK